MAVDAHPLIKDRLFGMERSNAFDFERVVPCLVSAAFDRINRRGHAAYKSSVKTKGLVDAAWERLGKEEGV